jgi:SAM-dependent methyltransferase
VAQTQHAGCANTDLPVWFKDWEQVRLDADEQMQPDVVASIADMGDIGTFDAVYCSHTLEHLHHNDVKKALKEFLRVINECGFVILFVPDLENVTDLENVKPDEEVLFRSPAGDICGLDLIYGFRDYSKDNPYMMHKTGFTQDTLKKELKEAGFNVIKVQRLPDYNLFAVAFPKALSAEKAKELSKFFTNPLEEEKCKQH